MFDAGLSARCLLELLAAAVMGGAVGFERELHGQGAGFRTNILIAVASCLMMQLSLHLPQLYADLTQNTPIRVDPGRIASYAISGMGFLGAGAILKGEGPIRGLTTAASLWLVTGAGLAVGAGFYAPAAFTVLLALFTLYRLRRLKPFFKREFHTKIVLKVDEKIFDFTDVERIISETGRVGIEFISYKRDLVARIGSYELRVVARGDHAWRSVSRKLKALDGILEVAWTDNRGE